MNSPSFAAVKKHALDAFPGGKMGGVQGGSDERDSTAGYCRASHSTKRR